MSPVSLNVLYLAHRLPYPPNKGDKIRSFHQIEYLSRRHRVWCACFVDDSADLGHVEALRGYCRDVAAVPLNRRLAAGRGLWALCRGGTLTEGYHRDARMRRIIERWSHDIGFDAVVVFSSGMAPYGLSCRADRRVIDFCDWDSRKWAACAERGRGIKSRLLGIEARRLARREAGWIRAFDASVVVTEAEADDAPDPALRDRAAVVGNGVDIRPYVPPPPEPTVGFVGAMDYAPNVDAVCRFADRIWPKVLAEVPGASFQIVGRRPTAAVAALGRRPGIEVIGEVPDATTWVHRFAVSVAPLRIAQGMQNKVLEAMAAGRPVVLTAAAARGIGAADGEHYIIADEPAPIASAVASLLKQPQRASEIGLSARAFVQAHFDWGREMAKLDALLTDGRIRERAAQPCLAAGA